MSYHETVSDVVRLFEDQHVSNITATFNSHMKHFVKQDVQQLHIDMRVFDRISDENTLHDTTKTTVH